jgi:membrane associated rhomboid family serine protease
MQPFTRRWPVVPPPAWVILIAVNVGIFTAQKLVDVSSDGWLENWFGLSGFGVIKGFYWQFITYTFLHGGPMHLFANMIMLYFAGREVETLLGPRHFLSIYFGGGLLGGIAQWAFSPPGDPVIGASACVCATLLAFTTILPEMELTCLLFFVIPIRLRAKTLAMLIVGSSVACVLIAWVDRMGEPSSLLAPVQSLFRPFSRSIGSIAHLAHLGGCLFGWFYVKQLGYGNPLRIQRYFLEKKQQEERRKLMTPEQFITEEIDPILEKIGREGIRSLTRNERRILRMGSEKIEKSRC